MTREEFIRKLIKQQVIDTMSYRYFARPTIVESIVGGGLNYIVKRITYDNLRKHNSEWEYVGLFDSDGKCISE